MCQGRYRGLRKAFLLAVIAFAAITAAVAAHSAELTAAPPANSLRL